MADELDQFFTRRGLALDYKRIAYRFLGDTRPTHVLEPSAGNGAFIEDRDGIVAFDKAPAFPGTLEIDSVDPAIPEIMREAGITDVLAIGNPPFGKKGKLAREFIETYLAVGGIVAFVLPLTFRRWSVQKLIRSRDAKSPNARLILDLDMPFDAFHLPDGSPREVHCCFQIWSTRSVDQRFPDLRLQASPPNKHPDFAMKRTNAQGENRNAIVFRNFAHDIAVPMQGVGSFDILPKGQIPETERHHLLIKAITPTALPKLRRINFERLSWLNTSANHPGYSMTDVVDAYTRL